MNKLSNHWLWLIVITNVVGKLGKEQSTKWLQDKKPFAYHITGFKGTGFLFCMLPNRALIPSIQSTKSSWKAQKVVVNVHRGENLFVNATKKSVIKEDGYAKSKTPLVASTTLVPWNPRCNHALCHEWSWWKIHCIDPPAHSTNTPGSKIYIAYGSHASNLFRLHGGNHSSLLILVGSKTSRCQSSLIAIYTNHLWDKVKRQNCDSFSREKVITKIEKKNGRSHKHDMERSSGQPILSQSTWNL